VPCSVWGEIEKEPDPTSGGENPLRTARYSRRSKANGKLVSFSSNTGARRTHGTAIGGERRRGSRRRVHSEFVARVHVIQLAPSVASTSSSICLLLVRRVPEFRGISIGHAPSRRRARSRSNSRSDMRRRPSLVSGFSISGDLGHTVSQHNFRRASVMTAYRIHIDRSARRLATTKAAVRQPIRSNTPSNAPTIHCTRFDALCTIPTWVA
jgi:hypothetical protein